MRGASNDLDLNILRRLNSRMDNTNFISVMQTMFAGTSFESEMNNLLTDTEFMSCMMAFQQMVPSSMPTTREEKDACILEINSAFESSPAFQTPFGQLVKPLAKSYLCQLIEAPSMGTVVGCLNNMCEQAGVGVNDREDLRNGLITALDAAVNAVQPPANPEPSTENS